MTKQLQVKIDYADASVDKFIIHSDNSIEWLKQEKTKTGLDFIRLFSGAIQINQWFNKHNAVNFEVKEQDET